MSNMKHIVGFAVISAAFNASTSWAQMDHGEMQMQGGSAPDNARDPHAYSDGYTLTDGPYAQQGPRQLKLADEHAFLSVLGDRLEYSEDSGDTTFDLLARYGTTYDSLVVKAEGDTKGSQLEESQTDLLWSHAISVFFDTQLGVRLDQYKEGSDRQWLAAGIQGLAPYWFELDATAYLGDDGRTALTFEAEYELLLTQKLVLQPRAELNLYGKDDPSNGLGSGLSDLSIGLRLRYEISRQFAPYVGVEWSDAYGGTADYRQAAGQDINDTQLVAGLRFWF
ncbi:Copper resistance protein B [Zhongshania aliphaticivorans]|jgi:copper resistance protein B|uniref:Copper resistance protein B n=2 Tax=Zhongshania TaxID=1434050 RepID=A0A5S9NXZ2_9GAMM|nr:MULTISPECIES: copper resistance protein B [Zhongshania]MBW2941446.1 copper resistance protein B [Zhongshania aquimaris]CAA0089006.1 Copper resistance protein B [Zhongshania aliphaticivorans]CAA0095553.1 Copper resistance protein B [Zhongshania aliphaticivorans]|tara:strand:+ start:465235 stop:466074 length:840 start_codon:yes stop_codon:yes gene_type:complete